MKDIIAFCKAICMMIGRVKVDLRYQACKRQGNCKACTLSVNSININSRLMIQVIRIHFHVMGCGNLY